ncbi:EamA family transporter [Deltaproteobacteria bacterium Smac51]|nr:EamA family transporter [Deltaproteobacteria bacterium Smac51]
MAENNANALQLLEAKQLKLAKIGIITGIISGMLWGASGTTLWEALNFEPFTSLWPEAVGSSGAGLEGDAATVHIEYLQMMFGVASGLSLAFMHDFFAALWVLGFNGAKGKFAEYARSLKTTPGKLVCVGAILGGPVGMSGYLLGVTFAGPVYSLPITASYPALAAVLSFFILKERNPLRVWIGVLACICGSLIIAWGDPGVAPNFKLGIALSTLACIGWATEGLFSTYGMDMLDPDVALGIREGFSALVLGLIVLPCIGFYMASKGITADVATSWELVGKTFTMLNSPAVWLCLLGGLFGGFSYIAWYRTLNACGVARGMAFNVTYAFWGVLFGFLMAKIMGREAYITANAWIGAAIICVGAILVSINPKELFKLRDAC